MPFTYTENEQPGWLRELYEKLGPKIAYSLDKHYVTYNANRLAKFNEEQERAFEMAKEIGKYAPYYTSANTGIEKAEQTFPSQYEQYLNPYIRSVIDNIAHEGNRNFRENILPEVQSQFIGLGQHGSGRHQDLVARMARDAQEAILRKQLEAYSGAYEHSGRMFNADQERQLHAAQTQADLGSKVQASHLNDVAAISSVGDQQQQQTQQDLDMAYQEFLNQQNYMGDKLVQNASVLHGIPYQGQAVGSSQIPPAAQPRVNTLGQLGSLAGNLLGARMAQGIPRKRGGSIRKHSRRYGLSSIRV